MPPDSFLVRKVLVDLLRIARVAMPRHLQGQDARLIAAEELIAALEDQADVDVEAGLDLFLREDFAPSTRTEAISAILRDWLIAHGYLVPPPAMEDRH